MMSIELDGIDEGWRAEKKSGRNYKGLLVLTSGILVVVISIAMGFIFALNPAFQITLVELIFAGIQTLVLVCFGFLTLALLIVMVLMNADLAQGRGALRATQFTLIAALIGFIIYDVFLNEIFGFHVMSISTGNLVFPWIISVIQIIIWISLILLFLLLAIQVTLKAISIDKSTGMTYNLIICVMSIGIVFILNIIYINYYGVPIIIPFNPSGVIP